MKKTAIYQQKRPGAPDWFNKWVQSPQWLLGFAIVSLLCVTVYAAGSMFVPAVSAGALTTAYGIAAALVSVAVVAYGGRRRAQRVRSLGRTWYYLEVHVYGGALFLLLMLMHSSFRLPQGVLTWWLWAASLYLTVSGLLGLVLQKWIPTLLASGLSVEVHLDRIPDLIVETRQRAEALLESAAEPVRAVYEREIAPVMVGPQPRWIYFVDATGGFRSRARRIEHIRRLLPESDRAVLDEMLELYRTKLEMDAHFTLQRVLRLWLYLHVPVALLMFGLLAMHVLFVLYY
jgi:hypothetical protein